MAYKYHRIRLKNGKKIDEHRLVWESVNGTIPPCYVIHHINEIKSDNRIDNLQLMTRAAHGLLHWKPELNENLKHPAICGTTSSYRRGCRCNECKAHATNRMRIYRLKKKLAA